ncbi:MAG: hypothetical protein ACKO6N_21460 [Myxococcota bacterium]
MSNNYEYLFSGYVICLLIFAFYRVRIAQQRKRVEAAIRALGHSAELDEPRT